MKKYIKMKKQLIMPIAVAVLGLSSATINAAEYYLCAGQTQLTMPDGAVVDMWGYAQGSFLDPTCVNSQVQVPGPELTVPDTDNQLIVHLQNNLPAASVGAATTNVSIVVVGQSMPTSDAAGTLLMGSETITDSKGRTRVTSFTTSVAPTASDIYYFNNIKSGSYLYHSGTHAQVQMQMGLYGAMTKDIAPGQLYGASTAYERDVTILYSEIDPKLHTAVATGNYRPCTDDYINCAAAQGVGIMTSTIDYKPEYYLINGKPFDSGSIYGNVQTSFWVGEPNVQSTTLLRFINAGLKSHFPQFIGSRFTLVAEDGKPYSQAKDQYSLDLHAAKTKDVLLDVNTATTGQLASIVDRSMDLVNGPSNSSHAGATGGMLAFLNVDVDSDADGVADFADNCINTPNGPTTFLNTAFNQLDTDGDGYGNACDADYNQNCTVGIPDFIAFRGMFGTNNPEGDFNGDGSVGIPDFIAFRGLFGGVPGPSGVAPVAIPAPSCHL